jgi:hypothetical protein
MPCEKLCVGPNLGAEPGSIKAPAILPPHWSRQVVEHQFVGVLQSNSRREFRAETLKFSGEYTDEYAL